MTINTTADTIIDLTSGQWGVTTTVLPDGRKVLHDACLGWPGATSRMTEAQCDSLIAAMHPEDGEPVDLSVF